MKLFPPQRKNVRLCFFCLFIRSLFNTFSWFLTCLIIFILPYLRRINLQSNQILPRIQTDLMMINRNQRSLLISRIKKILLLIESNPSKRFDRLVIKRSRVDITGAFISLYICSFEEKIVRCGDWVVLICFNASRRVLDVMSECW